MLRSSHPGVRPLGWLARQRPRSIERMFDARPERLRGRPKVWVYLACVVDDARSRPAWDNPRGYDMSLIVPGLLVMRLATAHGREVALVETRLLRADGRPPGLRVTLLVLGHAVTPRVDQPARPEQDEAQPLDP